MSNAEAFKAAFRKVTESEHFRRSASAPQAASLAPQGRSGGGGGGGGSGGGAAAAAATTPRNAPSVVSRAMSAPASTAAGRAAMAAEAGRRARVAAEMAHDRMRETAEDSRALFVHNRQRKNKALLVHVKNVPLRFGGDFVPDFLLGNGACALFLSVRYHRLHPDYIKNRVGALGRGYRLRVILALVDVEDFVKSMQEITRFAMLNDCTVMTATSHREAARYLETYKLYENKKAEEIATRKALAGDVLQQVTDMLTKVPGVNKTDALNLLTAFGSVRALMQAPAHELALCPGVGPKKAQRLREAFTDSLNRLKKA